MKKGVKQGGGKAWKIIGFILGVVSILTCWLPTVGVIIAIPGIIISIIAIKKSGKRGFALTALVLNIIAFCIGLFVVFLLGGIIYLYTAAGSPQPVVTENATNYNFGEKISFGNISITVQSAEKTKQLINNQNQIIPVETSGSFISVKILVENEYASTQSFKVVDPFVIIDSQGRTFISSSNAERYYPSSITMTTQFQPGVPYNGIKIFDVPKDSTGLELSIQAQVGNSIKLAHINLEK